MMKSRYLIWSLVLLPSLGGFIGPYLAGRRMVPSVAGDILIGFLSILLLPWGIALLVAFVVAPRSWLWVLWPILVLEYTFCFFVPSPAKAHLLGVAHRLTGNISPIVVRAAGVEMTRERHDGSLRKADLEVKYRGIDHAKDYECLVETAELPRELQGKFAFVAFRDGRNIEFAVNFNEGFWWSSELPDDYRTKSYYPLGDGLWVFRFGGLIDVDDGHVDVTPSRNTRMTPSREDGFPTTPSG